MDRQTDIHKHLQTLFKSWLTLIDSINRIDHYYQRHDHAERTHARTHIHLYCISDMAPQSRDLIRQLSASATNDAESKLRAVRSLKNEIIGSQNKKQCYLELGAVPKIVQLLASQQEKKLTVQAAATLGSFAYGNDAGVTAVVERSTIPSNPPHSR